MLVKARQFGFTTLYCIDMLDEALWNPGYSAAILAHEREAVDKIFQIVKRAFEGLPEEIKPKVNKDTERAYRFERRFDGKKLDSEIYVALKLRSTTVKWEHITESAYIKDRQELAAGSKQAVPKGGKITEETTGNGFNEFYDDYMRYHEKQNKTELDYFTYFYPWFENPEYQIVGELAELTPEEISLQEMVERERGFKLSTPQLLWRRWKMDELRRDSSKMGGLNGNQLFKQEYPSTLLEAFQSGAGFVFDVDLLEKVIPKPLLRKHNGIDIWVESVENRKYIVGCDPSDGAVDYGVIDVWDMETLEQCAQYVGKLRPDELAEKIREMAEIYNNALTGVENNQLSTVLFLSKIYDNLYFTTKEDERTQTQTKKLGWSTNSKTRDLMIDEFIILFEDGSLQINSPLTLSQMRTFVKKDDGKREHADGKHDDALFAGMIAVQMRKFNTMAILDFYRNQIAEQAEQKS